MNTDVNIHYKPSSPSPKSWISNVLDPYLDPRLSEEEKLARLNDLLSRYDIGMPKETQEGTPNELLDRGIYGLYQKESN